MLTSASIPDITEALALTLNEQNTYVGIGDSDAPESIAQTDLQATTNKLRKLINSGSIAINGDTITMAATFNADDANYAWKEFAVFKNNVMIARKVKNNGTKLQGQTWVIEVELKLAASAT